MKLYGVTTTYNNRELVPHVMKYAENLGYDKLIVYDNGSTDGTPELLRGYPFVEVREYKSSAFSEEDKRSNLMRGFWDLYAEHNKEQGGRYVPGVTEPAWCTITDFDEVVYFQIYDYIHFKEYLRRVTDYGVNVFTEPMLNLLSESGNKTTDLWLHKQVQKCSYGDPFDWEKPLLFRMDNIWKIDFYLGQHVAEFEFFEQPLKVAKGTRSIHVFHLKYALGLSYLIKRHDNMIERGAWSADSSYITDVEGTLKRYMDAAIDIKDYFTHKMLNGIDPMFPRALKETAD